MAKITQAMIIGSFHKLCKDIGVGRLSAKGLFLFTKSTQNIYIRVGMWSNDAKSMFTKFVKAYTVNECKEIIGIL